MATKHKLQFQLNEILNRNLYKGARKHIKDKQVGHLTQQRRAQIIRQAFEQLYELGYKIAKPEKLREKHVKALVDKWLNDGLSASTIQVRLSTLRTFSTWIGLNGMIKSIEHYVEEPERVKRSYVAQEDKSWSGHDTEPMEKIREVISYDKFVGVQLLLEYVFALRSREAWMIRPHIDHDSHWLRIVKGTKGGRERSFPLRHDYEYEALNIAKRVVGQKGYSMVPPQYSISQWKDRYYRILRKFNISRASKLVAHGLRHERINREYFDLTGCWMTIKGGKPGEVDEALDQAAREHLSAISGHSRTDIITAYGGSKSRKKKQK